MTIFELIKKYGRNRGEDVMWQSTEMISELLEKHLTDQELSKAKRKIYEIMAGGHYNKEFADEQMTKMYYINNNGIKRNAPYWTEEEVMQVYESVKNSIPEYNFYDFEVTLNMIKSDNCQMLKKWFPNEGKEERTQRFITMAVNWLKDEDNPFGTCKIWGYFNN